VDLEALWHVFQGNGPNVRAPAFSVHHCPEAPFKAATQMISRLYPAPAICVSPQARAGEHPSGIHASQTAFNSS
jgi:hypothetical protein